MALSRSRVVKLMHALPALKRGVFAAACGEALLPLYEETQPQGKYRALGKLLERVWDSLARGARPVVLIPDIDAAAADLVPDAECPYVASVVNGSICGIGSAILRSICSRRPDRRSGVRL